MLQATSGTSERLKTVEVLDENKSLCTQGNVCKLAEKLATEVERSLEGLVILGRQMVVSLLVKISLRCYK